MHAVLRSFHSLHAAASAAYSPAPLGRLESVILCNTFSACQCRQWSSIQAASESDVFGPLPALPQLRVVVTGIGMVTPLGVGLADSWAHLMAGRTGVRQLQEDDLPEVSAAATENFTATCDP
jgi:hypothetical protein